MAVEPTRKAQPKKKPPPRSAGEKAPPNQRSLPPAYLRLVEQFRLRPLQNAAELNQAIALVDHLVSRKEPLLPEEEDYLEVLSDLIERYEDRHEPVPDVSAVAMLRFLIDQHGVTQQTVAKETGIANSTISAVLNGDRELTRRHIEKLAAYFGAEPVVFLPGNS
jgi:HTH-type transcriptional regulator/antitoxin HigA